MKYVLTPLTCFILHRFLILTSFFGVSMTIIVHGKTWGHKEKTKDDDNDNNIDNGYLNLVTWMKSHGGRVDERITIAIDKHNGIRGAIATNNVPEGTELLYCPWKLIIGSTSLQDQMQTEEDMCNVVRIMASEIRLGDESMGYPYLNHIELPRLGAGWENEAVQELQGIDPSHDINRHNDWFSKNCNGGNPDLFDDATNKSLVSFISRASAVGMIPIYDLLNHHNGLKNAKLFLHQDGVFLNTIKPVAQGEQLYLSYGVKASSQMFRDYGFVESWPSLWSWKDQATLDNHVFALFNNGIVAIHPSAEFLKDIWTSTSQKSEAECQVEATKYTQSLPSDSLVRFNTAAQYLLVSLPTTLQEDEVILKEKKEVYHTTTKRGSSSSSSKAILALGDIIEAIQYRIFFKRAVLEALSFSKQALEGFENEL